MDSLDPEQLRQQLEELDRRQAALRVLLRAALARQRRLTRPRLVGCVENAEAEDV